MNNIKQDAIIVDLDRTLVDSSVRTKMYTLSNGKLDFDNLHKGILEFDKIDDSVDDMVYSIEECYEKDRNTLNIIFLSGRNNNAYDETWEFLNKRWYKYHEEKELILRETNDYRPNHEFKKEHLLQLNEKYNIIMFIDDDISCCAEAMKIGIPSFCYMSPHNLDDYTKNNIIKFAESLKNE